MFERLRAQTPMCQQLQYIQSIHTHLSDIQRVFPQVCLPRTLAPASNPVLAPYAPSPSIPLSPQHHLTSTPFCPHPLSLFSSLLCHSNHESHSTLHPNHPPSFIPTHPHSLFLTKVPPHLHHLLPRTTITTPLISNIPEVRLFHVRADEVRLLHIRETANTHPCYVSVAAH